MKILEKIINTRLVWWLEHYNILNNNQFGFRPNRSCIDSLALLLSEIQRQFYKRQNVVALFLDIKGAYDNVIPEIVIEDLVTLGIPNNLIKFIYNLISERNITFTNYPGNITRTTYRGLPQGSSLSPVLFNIYINNIVSKYPDKIKILKFADDLALYTYNKKIDTSISLLEQDMVQIESNLNNKNLLLAPDKCYLVIFNKTNISTRRFQIKISGTLIKPSQSVKFLGLTLTSNLNWKPNIQGIINRCKLPLNILSCVRGTWWGADPKTLLTLFKSLVRSKIEYGSFLISPCKPYLFYELEKIQLKCLRLIMGYRTSHNPDKCNNRRIQSSLS